MKKIVLMLILLNSIAYSAIPPKHEFRAVWVTTAWALDFPRSNWSTSAMQGEIRTMLDSLKNNGFNAVIFQVRPGCDAFYDSAYEPWSHHLTGTSGAAPSPYYDPLQTWIDEAHARNMELHAWFNPYRVSTSGSPASLHSSHVYHQHPEWLLSVASMAGVNQEDPASDPFSGVRDLRESLILDPGKAAVRNYVTNVFLDVVNNYDVDGVHMDDYFYPYGGMNNEDEATFAAESRGFTDVADWRRDNVNLLVAAIYDSIQVVKPWVKYGVSPFGIWKSGTPPGIIGTSSYYDLYCDPVAWFQAGTIDYLTPQLYWEFGGAQDYGSLMPWWAQRAVNNNRHMYPGHAPYRMTDWHNWPAVELPRQVRRNRVTEGCQGSVFFRLRSGIVNNPKGFLDSLDNDLYRYPALIPPMSWKDDIQPLPPTNVYFSQSDELLITWTAPGAAEDGDTADHYVIYQSNTEPVDITTSENILAILSDEEQSYPISAESELYYAVTSLDRLGNESDAVQVPPVSTIAHLLPDEVKLLNSYPNPFNPSTYIRYELPDDTELSITIHNVRGRQVKRLVEGSQPAGSYQVLWNGQDESGLKIEAGIYFCTLRTGNFTQTQKLTYLR